MTKRLLSLLVALCVMLCVCPLAASAQSEDIVILYENDVHCAVDGYAKIAALKNELGETYPHVGVVSVGDYIQGSSLGAISQGEYIVNIMNLVGYDAVILGNHEFDYRLEQLHKLVGLMDTKPVCSNFQKLGEEQLVFDPYTIVSYGDADVAYIGITTPDTLTSSSPSQFLDENGNYVYTFHQTDLYDTVQLSIDAAKADGADIVVALSHLGTENVNESWSAQALVRNTDGIDVVLDGHSHSTVASMTVTDEGGNDVIISSTGAQFANIGKLTIAANGDITTELVETASYDNTDEEVVAYIAQINEEYAVLGERLIGQSLVDLIDSDENGNRLIRHTETNLGDFCADAFRVVTGADVGVINGGGIRAGMSAGDVTFNDILSVFPFNNTVCVAEVTGQQLVDFLELAVMSYPEENGTFQHVSGITFRIDDTVESSVTLDENGVFVSVDGERRIWDVKVLDSEAGSYAPIDLLKTYSLASHNYLLIDHGSGASMFGNAAILQNSGMLDVELLEVYITEHLGGVIGAEYAASQNRITTAPKSTITTDTTTVITTTTTTAAATTTTPLTSPQTGDSGAPLVILLILVVIVTLCAAAAKRSPTN